MGTFILNEIREIIKSYNIDIEVIFNEIDKDSGGTLDLEEFSVFMHKIAPRIQPIEIKDLFDKFDENSDGTLSFWEF